MKLTELKENLLKDIYNLPFKNIGGHNWVYDKKDIFVFQFERNNQIEIKQVLRILNGEEEPKNNYKFEYDNGNILVDNTPFIKIRGWGYLTGRLNLTEEEAINVQDTLAEWIIEKLTKNK